MIYKETEESRELVLYTVNDETLYRQRTIPTIENLKKKYKRGIYDSEKAVDLWYYVATAASDKYNRDFGYRFTVQERFTAAVELEKYYREHIEESEE